MNLPSSTTMQWATGCSRQTDPAAAAREAVSQVLTSLGQGPVDLAVAFFSAPLVAGSEDLRTWLKALLDPRNLVGVSACGVVTTDEEIERGPALSLLAGRLPGVELSPMILSPEGWDEALEREDEFNRMTPGAQDAEVVLLFGDPFTLDMETVLQGFNRHLPGTRLAGGMASAAQRLGGNGIFLNDWQSDSGGVAIALSGGIRADVVVSQGCRSVGPPLEVTHSERNLIHTLDGSPALQRIEQVLRELPVREREQVVQGLFVGRPTRKDSWGQGDYLIRSLVGTDRQHGILAVADDVPQSEMIRLHVRDGVTAREDLELLLCPQTVDSRAQAALLFTCNGRGTKLFGSPNGDVGTMQEALGGAVPGAGMFCAGEIGPVGGRNYLHGHTASVVILRPR